MIFRATRATMGFCAHFVRKQKFVSRLLGNLLVRVMFAKAAFST